jgi:hypothetical protein
MNLTFFYITISQQIARDFLVLSLGGKIPQGEKRVSQVKNDDFLSLDEYLYEKRYL